MSSFSRTALSRLGRAVDRGAGRVLDYRRWAISLFSGYCAASVTITYLWEFSYGDGASMYPTIPDGNYYAGNNKRYKDGHGLKVGDVVQVWSPVVPAQKLGKRVIGLPGDYILKSKSHSPSPGNIPVPGITDWKRRLQKDSGASDTDEEEWDEPEMIRVPEGHIWIEGDNQAWSKDSRDFGPVPLSLVIARSSWIVVNWSRWQSLNPGSGLRKVEDDEVQHVLGPD